MRVRTGIDLYDDGWRVVQEVTNPDGSVEHNVYDPPFATEAEAETKATEAAALFREVADQAGAVTISRDAS